VTRATVGRLRIGVLAVVCLVVDTTFGADLRLSGVGPDLMLLLAICAGMTGGAEAGALVGFAVGLLADLSLTTTPLGLSALSWCLVGWGVGTLRARVSLDARSALPLVALVATLGGVIVFLVVGDLVGESQLSGLSHGYLVRVALIESLWNALLAIPVGFVYERAARATAGASALLRPDAPRAARPSPSGAR
jgi:rod shape-determining protein MreD